MSSSIPVEHQVKPVFCGASALPATVNPATTAVLFMEIQNDFFKEGGKCYNEGLANCIKENNTLENCIKLAESARKAGSHVIHIPCSHGDKEEWCQLHAGVFPMAKENKWFWEGSEGREYVAEWKASMQLSRQNEVEIPKSGFDCFVNSGLKHYLISNKIETVIVCGLLTSLCVNGTVRTAYELGWNTYCVGDCCASSTKEEHDWVMTNVMGVFATCCTREEMEQKLKEDLNGPTA